ncbi:hypothetical protein CPT76_06030 [Paenibacillus sp. AR247]|nr:hypothetical protein CPT76_06030 [Paenibacillus sp. AR247]
MVVGDASLDIDTLVIGAGPGGYVAAIRAAQLGQKVLIVDKSEVGGVCLNRGCIPSKALIAAAHQYESAVHGESFGVTAENVKVDFGKTQEFKNGVVKKLTGGVAGLLKGNKVEIFNGECMFINENEARVFNEHESPRYRFKNCIIATGSRPIELKAFPFGGRILSSTEALSLPEIPKSMVVIGGGYIGAELGQMYSKFGTKVTIIEGLDSILNGFDPDMTKLVVKSMTKTGVEIITNAKAESATQTDSEVTVKYSVNGETKEPHRRVEASNLIAELGLAIEMGATLEDIALTIHAHPTLGEIVMETAELALGNPIHVIAPAVKLSSYIEVTQGKSRLMRLFFFCY